MQNKDNRIYTYETHALQMQPKDALQSNFGALQQHYQCRRPARDEIVIGEVSEHSTVVSLHIMPTTLCDMLLPAASHII